MIARSRSNVGTAAVAVLAAVVLLLVVGRDPSPGPLPTAVAASYTPTDYAALVVHDGDRVQMDGHVVVLAGALPRMCADALVASPEYLEPQPIRTCSPGVTLRGLDADRLDKSNKVGQDVEGSAVIDGTYRTGVVTVDHQGKPVFSGLPPDPVVCDEPAGGWPKHSVSHFAPATRYAETHPGTIVSLALLRPEPGHEIVFAATAGDPEAVDAALRPIYGTSLCVVRSQYSTTQINAAYRAFSRLVRGRESGITVVLRGTIGDRGQPAVDVQLFRVTPRLAALASAQPPGLVQLQPALFPLH